MYYLYSSTIHPVFQLTTSRGGRRIPITLYPAISVFQLTTSRRSRRVMHFSWSLPKLISTHDLTKRSTGSVGKQCPVRSYFNSRPHEEVDQYIWSQRCDLGYFNSRPHEEVDSMGVFDGYGNPTFQLTTSRRGRQSMSDCSLQGMGISTHDLTKRSTS